MPCWPCRFGRAVSAVPYLCFCFPQVVCGPWWSMAVTADGYCYAWGSADGGWTGLERPPGLSVVDPGPTNDRCTRQTADRQQQKYTYDEQFLKIEILVLTTEQPHNGVATCLWKLFNPVERCALRLFIDLGKKIENSAFRGRPLFPALLPPAFYTYPPR